MWGSDHGAGEVRLKARLVYSNGALGALNTLTSGHFDHSPAVAYNSQRNEYLVVFTRLVSVYVPAQMDVYGLRLNAQGQPIDVPFGVNVDPDIEDAARVVYNSHDDEYLVVYQNRWQDGVEDIDARRIRGDGVPLEPDSGVNVVTGPVPHGDPDVAYNPGQNNYVIVYTRYGSPTSSIRFNVAPASLAELSISHDAQLCPHDRVQYQPSVAASEDEFMAVWVEAPGPSVPNDRDIRARRISGMGVPLGPDYGFDVGATAHTEVIYGPRVASGGRFAYLAVWAHDAYGPPYSENVEGRFIPLYRDHPGGSELSIDVSLAGQTDVDVACAAVGDCLVVSARGGSGTAWDISGRLVSPLRVYLPLALRQ